MIYSAEDYIIHLILLLYIITLIDWGRTISGFWLKMNLDKVIVPHDEFSYIIEF